MPGARDCRRNIWFQSNYATILIWKSDDQLPSQILADLYIIVSPIGGQKKTITSWRLKVFHVPRRFGR